jgi:hypothetical protein
MQVQTSVQTHKSVRDRVGEHPFTPLADDDFGGGIKRKTSFRSLCFGKEF